MRWHTSFLVGFLLLSAIASFAWSVKDHENITYLAVKRLLHDGFKDDALFFNQHLSAIVQGVRETDLSPQFFDPTSDSRHHGHDFQTHKGFLGAKSAGEYANFYLKKAIELLSRGDEDGYHYLGAALHLVGDSALALHSRPNEPDNLVYHSVIENYAEKRYREKGFAWLESAFSSFFSLEGIYSFHADGIHHNPAEAFGWVDFAAHESAPYYNRLKTRKIVSGQVVGDNPELDDSLDMMFRLAVRLSAGFLHFAHAYIPPHLRENENWTKVSFAGNWSLADFETSRGLRWQKTQRGISISGEGEFGDSLAWKKGTSGNFEVMVKARGLSPKGYWAYGLIFRQSKVFFPEAYRLQYDFGLKPKEGLQLAAACHKGDRLCQKEMDLDNDTHELRVVAHGETATCFLDNNYLFTYQSLSEPGGKGVGFFVNHGKKAELIELWYRPLRR